MVTVFIFHYVIFSLCSLAVPESGVANISINLSARCVHGTYDKRQKEFSLRYHKIYSAHFAKTLEFVMKLRPR